MPAENKPKIVVWFSCGAPSAVAAYLTKKIYGDKYEILVVNNPVAEEDPDNIRFKNDVAKWLGVPVLDAKNDKIGTDSAGDIWEKRKYMSGIKGAPCTFELKKEARYQFELKHNIAFHVLGFTLEEKHRHERFTHTERSNVIPVLIDELVTRQNCFEILEEAGIKLPDSYKHFANANCIGCPKATSPTYWNKVREIHPKVFKLRAELSRRLGARLVRYKGKRIFLDELPKDAKGRKIKSYECGIFCDTK